MGCDPLLYNLSLCKPLVRSHMLDCQLRRLSCSKRTVLQTTNLSNTENDTRNLILANVCQLTPAATTSALRHGLSQMYGPQLSLCKASREMIPRMVRPTNVPGAFTNQRQVNITEIPIEEDRSQHTPPRSNGSSGYGKANAFIVIFEIRIRDGASPKAQRGNLGHVRGWNLVLPICRRGFLRRCGNAVGHRIHCLFTAQIDFVAERFHDQRACALLGEAGQYYV